MSKRALYVSFFFFMTLIKVQHSHALHILDSTYTLCFNISAQEGQGEADLHFSTSLWARKCNVHN